MPGRLKMPIWKIRFSYSFILFIFFFCGFGCRHGECRDRRLPCFSRNDWRYSNGELMAGAQLPYPPMESSLLVFVFYSLTKVTLQFLSIQPFTGLQNGCLWREIGSCRRYKTRVKVSAGKTKWPLWTGGRCREVLVVSLWMTPFREAFEHLKETQNTVTVIKWLDREQDWPKHWHLVCW